MDSKIHDFLEASDDPLRCLMQIIKFGNTHPFLCKHSSKAFEALDDSSFSLLTPEIKLAIQQAVPKANQLASQAMEKIATNKK